MENLINWINVMLEFDDKRRNNFWIEFFFLFYSLGLFLEKFNFWLLVYEYKIIFREIYYLLLFIGIYVRVVEFVFFLFSW